MFRLKKQYPELAAGLDRTGLVMVKISARQGDTIDAKVFFEPFPAGYFEPEFTRRNLEDKDTFQKAVRKGLSALKTEKVKRISLVLPDSVSRIFLLDFEDIPSKRSDLDSLLRHKVKKILPFDTDFAALSYRLAYKKDEKYSFLAGFMYKPAAAQYEDYLQEIGLQCGLIDTRSNNLINLYNLLSPGEMQDCLYLILDSDYLTLVAEKEQDIYLYRGKPLTSSKRKDFIQREILQSIMFLFDRLGESVIPNAVLLSNRSGVVIDKIVIEKGNIYLSPANRFRDDIHISFVNNRGKEPDKDLILPVIGAAARSME
jgi:type IV pilus assembly protein PilM